MTLDEKMRELTSLKIKEVKEAKEIDEYLEDQIQICKEFGLILTRISKGLGLPEESALQIPRENGTYITIRKIIDTYNSREGEAKKIAVENLLYAIKREAIDLLSV